MKTVGILGLGNIGRAVADNLVAAGLEVMAVRRPSTQDFRHLAESPAELVRKCDVVVAALLGVGLLNVVFATHAGLWGVLIIDMIQFFIKMSAVVAAAYFALHAPQVGGLHGLMDKLQHTSGPGGLNYLSILPDFKSNWDLAVAVFIMPVAVQWWAVWYPGSEPGGGSYIAQRMLASKSERDALGSTLFFNLAHYVLRPWPWIITALCSIIIYPDLASIKAAFPKADASLIGHDSAFPAMLMFLPTGFVGLMIGGLIAANSSRGVSRNARWRLPRRAASSTIAIIIRWP